MFGKFFGFYLFEVWGVCLGGNLKMEYVFVIDFD